jgi:hypothetical protein
MKKNGFTHDSVDNLSVDWYTPPHIFDGLGVFDLDPCQPVGGCSLDSCPTILYTRWRWFNE